MDKAEVRGVRRPKVRKGTSDLTRVSQAHRVRTRYRRQQRPTLQAAIDEWADEMENESWA